MLRVVLATILLAHGIGHSMGLLQALKVATINPRWNGESWILTGIAGQSLTTAVGVGIWSATILAFTAVAGVMIGWLPEAWWQPLGIGAASMSLVGLILFPLALPTLSTIGALCVDVVLLVAVLWERWSPQEAL